MRKSRGCKTKGCAENADLVDSNAKTPSSLSPFTLHSLLSSSINLSLVLPLECLLVDMHSHWQYSTALHWHHTSTIHSALRNEYTLEP
jgi:hypothetical protein